MAGGGGGAGGEGDYGLQIAPMLDVMFVLLLFFMVSMANQKIEMELGINLPSGAAHQAEKPATPAYLKINPQGTVLYNDSVIAAPTDRNLDMLRMQLEENVKNFGPEKTPVIIIPSDRVQHQRVVDVMNAAAAAGVTNLSFGTS
jgi:biopolymer transport protein ExbD